MDRRYTTTDMEALAEALSRFFKTTHFTLTPIEGGASSRIYFRIDFREESYFPGDAVMLMGDFNEWRDDRGLVVSGTRGDRIFYRRWLLSCGDAVWNGLSIEYPAAGKQAYDPLVTHMSRSLRAGTGWQVENCPD